MQTVSKIGSDYKSFSDNFVLDSFNMASDGKDSILDQMYGKQICLDLDHEDFEFFL